MTNIQTIIYVVHKEQPKTQNLRAFGQFEYASLNLKKKKKKLLKNFVKFFTLTFTEHLMLQVKRNDNNQQQNYS